jgi:hypothetical protein
MLRISFRALAVNLQNIVVARKEQAAFNLISLNSLVLWFRGLKYVKIILHYGLISFFYLTKTGCTHKIICHFIDCITENYFPPLSSFRRKITLFAYYIFKNRKGGTRLTTESLTIQQSQCSTHNGPFRYEIMVRSC